MIKLTLANTFFLGTLVLRRATSVTQPPFSVVSLDLMSPSMSLCPISLPPLVMIVLFVAFLAYLLPILLRNHSRCIVIGNKLQLSLLPRLEIRFMILILFLLLYAKVSLLVLLIPSLNLYHITIYFHLFMLLLPLCHLWLFLNQHRRLCPILVGRPLWKKRCLPFLKMTCGLYSLVPLPLGKTIVGCRWVYAVKYLPNGSIEHPKACLVAKGYT